MRTAVGLIGLMAVAALGVLAAACRPGPAG